MEDLEYVLCPSCGTRNFSDDKKCGICNTRLLFAKRIPAKHKLNESNGNFSFWKPAIVIISIIIISLLIIFKFPDEKFRFDKDVKLCSFAQYLVENNLKAPSTAKFSPCRETKVILKEGKYHIFGYVDSQNSFGAMLRSNWEVILESDGNGSYYIVKVEIFE